jgi:hypothetical protein
MIHFPVFEHLYIDGYRLFPGAEGQPGLNFEVKPGISIVAGVNGLGKTTLINILFRLLVGPFELPKLETTSRFGSTARVKEIVWPARRDFFTRRVADRAVAARAVLVFRIADKRFEVKRALADCRLLSAAVDGVAIDVTDSLETAYKEQLVGSAGLGSFVDFLTMVKFLTFFNEERRDILWDDQAQRQFFRILFASPAISLEWVQHESEIGSADSSARNASTYASRLERDILVLEDALQKNAGVTAELAATQKLLDADLERQAGLESKADELKKQVSSITRQIERAKLAEDNARRQLEELRYTALGRLFPSLDETARYILTHLFADAHCLACGAEAKGEIIRLEKAITEGICAICGADPSRQERTATSAGVIPVHAVEQKHLDRALQAVANASTEREASERAESELRQHINEVNIELDRISRAIDERRLANLTLRARLPPDPEEIAEKRKAMQNARLSQAEYERQRARAEHKYQALLTQTEELFRGAAVRVAHRFRRFATAFLEEECALSFRLIEDRPSQAGARFMYPSLKFEMSAAAFETRQLRESPDDVSESQREFVDLAFRMALIEAASDNEAASLVIETPEASLDAIFMRKAGTMLRTFAEGQRRIIVTSNLTSSVMVPSLFGGETDDSREIADRWSRILDLLTVAAPNAAVRKFGPEYRRFLEVGVEGRLV